MSAKSLDELIDVSPDAADGKPRVANTDLAVQDIVVLQEYMEMTPAQIAGRLGLTLADVYAALAYFHHYTPPETRKEILENEKLRNLLKSDENGVERIKRTISKYSVKKESNPLRHEMIEVETKENKYKLIRLNDEQYSLLLDNSLGVHEDYMHLMWLARDKDAIFGNLSKMYVALYTLFGQSGGYYDSWKGSFSFPFLILKVGDEEFGYIMNAFHYRSSIEFRLSKLIHVDDDRLRRDVLHNPFDDFSKEEKKHFINYFIGFLTGYFRSTHDQYDEFFFQTAESNLIVYGYKDGDFFDNQYEDEEEYGSAIRELEKKRGELKG